MCVTQHYKVEKLHGHLVLGSYVYSRNKIVYSDFRGNNWDKLQSLVGVLGAKLAPAYLAHSLQPVAQITIFMTAFIFDLSTCCTNNMVLYD